MNRRQYKYIRIYLIANEIRPRVGVCMCGVTIVINDLVSASIHIKFTALIIYIDRCIFCIWWWDGTAIGVTFSLSLSSFPAQWTLNFLPISVTSHGHYRCDIISSLPFTLALALALALLFHLVFGIFGIFSATFCIIFVHLENYQHRTDWNRWLMMLTMRRMLARLMR